MGKNNKVTYFEECPQLRRFVTPFEAKTLPIHNWFIYPHSFSPSLIYWLIDQFNLKTGDVILDPFVGAGTTLLSAKELNISSVGLDILPVSVALSVAKTTTYNIVQLERDIAELEARLTSTKISPSYEEPQLQLMASEPNRILNIAFDSEVINEIIKIKIAVKQSLTVIDHMYFMLTGLLVLLEKFSNTKKTGGWLKIVIRQNQEEKLIPAFLAQLHKMFEDVKNYRQVKISGKWQALIGDARHIPSDLGLFNAVISSPPYLNRHDYTRVLCLELLVGFLDDYDELRDLRHSLLRSHIEAKAMLCPLGYQRPTQLDEIMQELQERQAENRLLRIVDGYFEDMFAVLRSIKQSLVNGGYCAFVLGNVRFSGLAVPVDEIIADIGETVGLKLERIVVARRRNNSAQQMREYGRDPARESIIIWQAC